MKRCPECGGSIFVVTAHVTQDWVVDELGDFLDGLNHCVDIVHRPDDDDMWECRGCGYEAIGRAFNVEQTETQEEDKCPVCGATIELCGGDEDGYGVLYMRWKCDRCGASGRSCFQNLGWEFVEHEVEE